jgi:hypothetical protein
MLVQLFLRGKGDAHPQQVRECKETQQQLMRQYNRYCSNNTAGTTES